MAPVQVLSIAYEEVVQWVSPTQSIQSL